MPAQSVARWDGQNWCRLASGLATAKFGIGPPPGPAAVQALAARGSELFVGGTIDTAGGKPSTNIALWHIPHALSAKLSGDTVTLSWPATGSNFVVESKSDLNLTNWSAVAQPPVVTGDQLVDTNSISPTNQFFRLRRR